VNPPCFSRINAFGHDVPFAVVSQPKSAAAELFTKNLVFFLQVLNGTLLSLVCPSREHCCKKTKGIDLAEHFYLSQSTASSTVRRIEFLDTTGWRSGV
jgi:hypothetical protein